MRTKTQGVFAFCPGGNATAGRGGVTVRSYLDAHRASLLSTTRVGSALGVIMSKVIGRQGRGLHGDREREWKREDEKPS
jgi:hypothetical protein